jgi:hypothetical protein
MVDTVESHNDTFAGFGWLFTISDSFPILAFIAFALYANKRKLSWPSIIFALIGFTVLKLIFGGLRGSRSLTVWGLFWATGIVHVWLRPLPKKLIIASLPLLFGFMYIYGFYKVAGREALRAFDGEDERAMLEQKTGRSTEALLLGDLARTDIQCYILYVFDQRVERFELAHGRTYLGAAALAIPGSLWPDRPPTKIKEGTELFYGEGSYRPDFFATHIYGLAGEAMMNFGPLAVLPAFLFFGWLVRRCRELFYGLPPGDARALLMPFLANLMFVVLSSDSDNVFVFTISTGSIPTLVVWLGSMIRGAPARTT